jgi:hypothetical protein
VFPEAPHEHLAHRVALYAASQVALGPPRAPDVVLAEYEVAAVCRCREEVPLGRGAPPVSDSVGDGSSVRPHDRVQRPRPWTYRGDEQEHPAIQRRDLPTVHQWSTPCPGNGRPVRTATTPRGGQPRRIHVADTKAAGRRRCPPWWACRCILRGINREYVVLPLLHARPRGAARSGPRGWNPLARRRILSNRQRCGRPGPAPGPPLALVVSLDRYGDARARVPHRRCRDRAHPRSGIDLLDFFDL